MQIKKDAKLYARIDYRIEGKGLNDQDLQDHMTYVKNIARERYFIGGGFSNADGGMCLFEAGNFEEAEKIAQNDPLMERGRYRYELFVWNPAVLSDDIE